MTESIGRKGIAELNRKIREICSLEPLELSEYCPAIKGLPSELCPFRVLNQG